MANDFQKAPAPLRLGSYDRLVVDVALEMPSEIFRSKARLPAASGGFLGVFSVFLMVFIG